jgi:ribosomal protein L17
MTPREPGVRDFTADQQASPAPHQQMSEEDYENFLREAREMVLVREQKTRIANREAELKKDLMDALKIYGDPYGTSGQHQTIEFPKAIRGIIRFVRQAKVTTEVNEEVAEAIARRQGIYDRLFKPVMTLDDSAVMVALREGILTDADVNAIFPQKTTFAFVAEKKK